VAALGLTSVYERKIKHLSNEMFERIENLICSYSQVVIGDAMKKRIIATLLMGLVFFWFFRNGK